MAEKHSMKQGAKNEFPYTPARLVESETEPYLLYYIWHVQKKTKVRKRVTLQGDTLEAKLKDAKETIKLINTRLKEGWHIDQTLPKVILKEDAEDLLLPKPAKDKPITFEEACAYYKAAKRKGYSDNTETLNDNYFRHLTKHLIPGIPLQSITAPMLYQFFDTTTVGARFHNTMLGFFKFFVKRGHLTVNPCEGVDKVRHNESEDHKPFNAEQAKAIRQAILDKGDQQLWLFWQFIYFLFLWPGRELRFLKVGDLLADQVRVDPGNAKNRRIGYVDIPTALEQLIKQYKLRDYAPTDYIFTIDGHPGPVAVGENYFYKRHRKIMEQLNLFGQDYDVYSWKPTGAIVLYRATKDILRVQRHCRHSTPDQTYTYLRKHGLIFEGQRVTEFPSLWE